MRWISQFTYIAWVKFERVRTPFGTWPEWCSWTCCLQEREITLVHEKVHIKCIAHCNQLCNSNKRKESETCVPSGCNKGNVQNCPSLLIWHTYNLLLWMEWKSRKILQKCVQLVGMHLRMLWSPAMNPILI